MGSEFKNRCSPKIWKWTSEAAGHIAPKVRKQREMNAGAQLCPYRDPSTWHGVTQIRAGLPSSLEIFSYMLRGVSPREF